MGRGMLIVALFSVAWFGGVALAQEWSESPLGKTRLGEVWMGAPISHDDLPGRVVLLKFWGYRCPACIGLIPTINKLQARYSKAGLIVIGAHAQGPARKKAIQVASKHGVRYTICSSARVPGKMTFKYLPYAFVFDHLGNIVYEGGATQRKMTSAIRRALKKSPPVRVAALLADMHYRRMARAVALVKAGYLGRAVALCEKNKDKVGATGLEAQTLLAAVNRHLKKLQDTAKDRAGSPSAARSALLKIKARFAGTEFATAAESELAELAKDEGFKTELAAEAGYKLIRAAISKATSARYRRHKAALIRRIKARLAAMEKAYPDSPFVQKAQAALKDLSANK